ncbi:MAG: hypothetical protein RLZZ555_573 [Pseudomonadota bacterium]|jgi:hemolysin activation/secretion protein
MAIPSSGSGRIIRRANSSLGILLLAVANAAQAQALQIAAPSVQSTRSPSTFQVDELRVEGNTLLSASAVEAALAGSTGPGRSLADLNQAASRLQRAYREAGYGGVLAFVPPQTLDGGAALIRVVEGRLASVRISGHRHFSGDNIRAGLPGLRSGATPYLPEVDRDIQLSNENPAKQLKVTLMAGARAGEIDAEVLVQDRKPLRYTLGLDDTGNARTGRYRLTAALEHANLSDRDDILGAQFQTSPGHSDQVKLLGLGYRLPIYTGSASVDLFYAHSDVSSGAIATLAGPLVFSGRGQVLSSRINLHLERSGGLDQRLGIGLDWRAYDNDCAFLDLGELGPAACGPAAVSSKAMPLALSYTVQAQSAQLAWGGNASLFANLGGSSRATFEAARPGASRNFIKTRLSGFGAVQLPNGFALKGDLETQFSPHALLSGEQFGIGGASSVRGYQERELTGDYGHLLRLELQGPAFSAAGMLLRPHLFIDQGRVGRRKGAACGADAADSCRISSAGAGLRISVSDRLTARLEWGRARDDGLQTASGDHRAHALVQFAF